MAGGAPLENQPKSRNPQGPDDSNNTPPRALGATQTFRGGGPVIYQNQKKSLALRAEIHKLSGGWPSICQNSKKNRSAARESASYLHILFMVRTSCVPFSACMGSREVGLKVFDSGKRALSARRNSKIHLRMKMSRKRFSKRWLKIASKTFRTFFEKSFRSFKRRFLGVYGEVAGGNESIG